MVELFFRNGGYDQEVQCEFKKKFPDASLPSRQAVYNLVARFRETGSVIDKPRSGRPSLLTDDAISNVSKRMETSPQKSVRRLSQESGLSPTTTHKALKKLELHPYRIRVVHELKEPDYEKRSFFCNWFKTLIEKNGDDLMDKIFFSDEAWFNLSGFVNSQNSRIWATQNPNAICEAPLHSEKIGVWCALSRKRIIGPIFFSTTITAERYQDIIHQALSLFTEDEINFSFFQQDSATCHTANSTLRFLEDIFADRVITAGLWPPRSPDLTPLDYFLWGHLKNQVYQNKPKTLNDLKSNIELGIASIKVETLKLVFQNLKKRVDTCLEKSGNHFEHFL